MNINKKQLGYQQFEVFMNQDNVNLGQIKMAFIGIGQGGSKICTEFTRASFHTTFINTSEQDLDYTISILEAIKRNGGDINYETIHLLGYDGARKNRDLGKSAVVDNEDLLNTKLREIKELIEADFVWITAALGGGTGNGALALVAYLINSIRRQSEKRANKAVQERPTVGVIAAIPRDDESANLRINGALALQEIITLQGDGIIGSCIPIDNEKLVNEYIEHHQDKYREWSIYGNVTVANTITEIVGALSLTGPQIVDSSELMDVFTTPSFLLVGKKIITENDLSDDDASIKKTVKDLLSNSNVLVDGYDEKYIKALAVIIVKQANSKTLKPAHEILYTRAINQQLQEYKAIAAAPHIGYHYMSKPQQKENESLSDKVFMYSFIANKKMPKRILKMSQEALALRKEQIEEEKALTNDLMGINLLTENIEIRAKQNSGSASSLASLSFLPTNNENVTTETGTDIDELDFSDVDISEIANFTK